MASPYARRMVAALAIGGAVAGVGWWTNPGPTGAWARVDRNEDVRVTVCERVVRAADSVQRYAPAPQDNNDARLHRAPNKEKTR